MSRICALWNSNCKNLSRYRVILRRLSFKRNCLNWIIEHAFVSKMLKANVDIQSFLFVVHLFHMVSLSTAYSFVSIFCFDRIHLEVRSVSWHSMSYVCTLFRWNQFNWMWQNVYATLFRIRSSFSVPFVLVTLALYGKWIERRAYLDSSADRSSLLGPSSK